MAKLSGGVAGIKVAGTTTVEVKERKDRVDDALNATRAAVEEGIVPGGRIMLLKAIKAIVDKGDNTHQDAGINIVRKALQPLIRQIARMPASQAPSLSAGSWTSARARSATTRKRTNTAT